MIDIHNHLLNNVDDGARDVIESITSLKLAEEAGFTDIILTPHYIENYYENSIERMEPKIDELKTKLRDNGVDISVHMGNEVYISDSIVKLMENGEVCTLAGSAYFLFELPQKNKILNLNGIIEQIKEQGCIPVLAHPERYLFVQQNPNVLKDFIKNGVIMQSNYGSIIGQYGKEAQKTIIKMLKSNMVHILGTDTHRSGYIYSHFDKVKKEFLKYVSEEKFIELTELNPEYILQNKMIKVDEPKKVKKGLFGFGI